MPGMHPHHAAETARSAADADPRTGLRGVAALRRLTERLEARQVANARTQGWSWGDIGAELGVSRQAVHKKHAAYARGVRRGG
jgi:DNA-binding NarL/FixJ family response regulator